MSAAAPHARTITERARREEDVVVGDEIVRHNLTARVHHWTVALLFFLCLFTGMPITRFCDDRRMPVRQRLERLLTIESQLETSGMGAVRRVIDFEFVKPPAHVMAELGVDRVFRVKRINLADGEPFAVVTVWCPAELGQHLSMADVERRPFYELLDIELRGATQTIGADLAEPPDAELLAVPAGSPLLKCRRVTTDTSGRPVLMSEHLFPAHRTEFVVDLPNDRPSSVPTGLRLVDNA